MCDDLLSVYTFIRPPVRLFDYMSLICLLIRPYVSHTSICLSFQCLSVCIFVNPSTGLTICLSVCLSICLGANLSFCLPICLSTLLAKPNQVISTRSFQLFQTFRGLKCSSCCCCIRSHWKSESNENSGEKKHFTGYVGEHDV